MECYVIRLLCCFSATKTAKICAAQQVAYLHNVRRIKKKNWTKFQSIKPILIQYATSRLQETGHQRQLGNYKSHRKRNEQYL
jgi:hypothetical protein